MSAKPSVNPYLPSYEYVPDGEPRVFWSQKDQENRVYVYGSHDAFGAPIFCVNDYVCWSAPVDDLGDWRFEGTIYRRRQDPQNFLGIRSLYAPDCVQGPDGRYYLYYAFDFMGRMGVAVCDEPAGRYEFYGHVRFPDGHAWGTRSKEPFPFDPAVLVDDDGRVLLYSGFATRVPFPASRWHNLTNEGAIVLELEPDMLTIRTGPKLLLPTAAGLQQMVKNQTATRQQRSFLGHAFFEASSIRKVDGKYCFVYSSQHNHELCWAMSDRPDGGFTYGGTLVDLGDLYLNGNEDETQAVNYLGNTHGGMLEAGGRWYIFYHRQTNRNSYARQACAEVLERTDTGGFRQAEVTSCGLNKGPLPGIGTYEARIACNLWSKQGTGRYDCRSPKKVFAAHPYFTQSGRDRECDGDQYIANMRDGAVAGFKYFSLGDARRIEVHLRGSAHGRFLIGTEHTLHTTAAEIPVHLRGESKVLQSTFSSKTGVYPLYFGFVGEGSVDFLSFTLV